MCEPWLQQILNKISPKNQAFIGRPQQYSFLDYFQESVPNAASWAITKDNDASVYSPRSLSLSYTYVDIKSGTGATEDAVMDTYNLKFWGRLNENTTTLHFKSTFKITDLTGEIGVGFSYAGSTYTADEYDGLNQVAAIHCDNDLVEACSSSAADVEKTDVSAYFIDNTFVNVEIIMSATDVKFKIDGTLRATHSTYIPVKVSKVGFAAKNTNGITSQISIKYVEVWAE